jgi:hypothetical protein
MCVTTLEGGSLNGLLLVEFYDRKHHVPMDDGNIVWVRWLHNAATVSLVWS